MAIVTLLLRDLQSGQRMTAEFETVQSCTDWLQARPPFVDVLGPVNEDLSPEGDRLLRAALRPYDAAERALMDQQRQQRDAKLAESAVATRAKLASAQSAERQRVSNLHANDPMTVTWQLGGPVTNAEPLDQRPVPEVVTKALHAWVAERNTWVKGRGQVCAAQLTVWPGEVPPGHERIHEGGQFEVK
jgi:hypothetical protein